MKWLNLLGLTLQFVAIQHEKQNADDSGDYDKHR